MQEEQLLGAKVPLADGANKLLTGSLRAVDGPTRCVLFFHVRQQVRFSVEDGRASEEATGKTGFFRSRRVFFGDSVGMIWSAFEVFYELEPSRVNQLAKLAEEELPDGSAHRFVGI